MNVPNKPGIYFQEVSSNQKYHGGYLHHIESTNNLTSNNEDGETNPKFITTRIKWGGLK